MTSLARSWDLTRNTLAVMRADPEMMIFPILSAAANLVFMALFLVPTLVLQVLPDLMGDGSVEVDWAFGVADAALLFTALTASAFTSTFFNVCVVFTAKTRFEGGDASFFDALRFAASRIPRIFTWSLVAATVGVLMKVLDQAAEKKGVLGMVSTMLRGLLGFAWTVIQLFVVPVMVYEDLGPIAAIWRSAEVARKTWGESLVRHVGLSLIQGLLFIPLLLGMVGSAYLIVEVGVVPGGVALAVVVGLMLLTSAVFRVANTVFNTALFHYATTGDTPDGFASMDLGEAFRSR